MNKYTPCIHPIYFAKFPQTALKLNSYILGKAIYR